MSKKITAGDTLTMGDLTDDYLGAEIEVDDGEGIVSRLTLRYLRRRTIDPSVTEMLAEGDGVLRALRDASVKVITPPPVVQPDEPTSLGQCIRIEGDDYWRAVVVESDDDGAPIRDTDGSWYDWDLVLRRAGDHQIIVSGPPRWPDETPAVPERIEVGGWPDDDTHLREWEWNGSDGDLWRWDEGYNGWYWSDLVYCTPHRGPWTRGERVK